MAMASSLRQEIEQLEQQIKELKLSTTITEVRRVEPDTSQIFDESRGTLHIDILRQKCKELQAQTDVIEKSKPRVLPNDATLQFDLVMDGNRKMISQTNDILKFQDNQRKELLENIDREQKIREELIAVVEAASERCKKIETETTSKEQVCDRLKSKCKQLDKLNCKLNKDMTEFIKEHYPLPDLKLFNSVKKKINVNNGGVELQDLASILPLTEVIKTLMKTNKDNPNNPYVELDHRFWPPYVELLQESDLIIRNPTDPRRIKLVPFHL